MRTGDVRVQGRTVRFLVEVRHDASERITGTVTAESGGCRPFHGWLELAPLLEASAVPRTSPDDGDESRRTTCG